MRVEIKYCRPCGYRALAEELATRVRAETGIEATLTPGNFGVFKVWVDGQLVFDKRATRGWLGRLGFGEIPNLAQLTETITSRLSLHHCR